MTRMMSQSEAADRRGHGAGDRMGGFVDGILFHQILQVHNMLSAVRPPITLVNVEINMFWDGLFHAFTWVDDGRGIALLWRAVKRTDAALSTRTFVGSLLLGWGLFNLVEGVIDHHLLGIHHVVERRITWYTIWRSWPLERC